MIPDSWKQSRLGDCLMIPASYGANAPSVDFSPILPRYLRITDIDDNGWIIKQDPRCIKHEDAEGCFLEEGDLVFARTGATVGKTYLHCDYRFPLAYAGYLIRVRVNPSKLLPKFLFQYTRSPQYLEWVALSSRAGAQPNINASEFCSLQIPLPPIEEQKAIVTVLSKWDRAIRQLTDLIGAKVRFKQGLMQQLLTGKRRFKGYRDEWASIQLRDVATECGARNRGQMGLDSVKAVTKAEGIIPMKERTIAADISRYLVVQKNWFAYNPMRINIGSIARWNGDNDVLVSPDYVVFRCNEPNGKTPGIDPDYLDHLRRSSIWENFVTAAGNGSVRVRIYFSDLGHLKFSLPGPNEQRKTANFLNAADREIDLLRKELEAHKQQKKGLMQKLLTGQVWVKP